MNRSESAYDRLKRLSPEQLDVVVNLFADATAAAIEPPPGADAKDLYMALHPDVRRLLVELGQPENTAVRIWLLQLDEDKVGLLNELLKDYKNTKSLVRLIKMIWIAIAGLIAAVYGTVKGAPELLDWLKGWISK